MQIGGQIDSCSHTATHTQHTLYTHTLYLQSTHTFLHTAQSHTIYATD